MYLRTNIFCGYTINPSFLGCSELNAFLSTKLYLKYMYLRTLNCILVFWFPLILFVFVVLTVAEYMFFSLLSYYMLYFTVYDDFSGAFLIPYFTCLVIIGIPVFYLELCFGQFASLGPLKIWEMNPALKGEIQNNIFNEKFSIIFSIWPKIIFSCLKDIEIHNLNQTLLLLIQLP